MKHAIAFTLLVSLASCQASPNDPSVDTATPGLFEGIASGQTRVIDLTHPLNAQNPHWPGPGYEPFHYEIFATLDKDGVLSGKFSMAEHTGTHLDAPNHFAEGQLPVDRIPPQQLFCPAVVIDVRQQVSQSADYTVTPMDVLNWEQQFGRIPDNALVFAYSGWDSRWSDFEKYKNADAQGGLHFPGFSAEAANLLAEERNIAGIGIDTLSVDPGTSKDFSVHHISHGKGKYHIENAANLGSLPASGAFVVVAPVKIENGTGGPARIFALVR